MKYLLMMLNKVITVLLVLAGSSSVQAQNDCFPKQDKTNRTLVYDASNVFSQSEESRLNSRLINISNNTSNQIIVVAVNDLCGMDKAMYATELGQKWGVGRKGKDNGLVILIKPTGGKGQRKTFIAVGYGLEGIIPDATAKMIVENEMIPNFKKGSFYKGVDAALNVIVPLAKQEFNYQAYTQRVNKSRKRRGGSMFYLLILFGVFYLLSRIFSARNYAQRNGMSLWSAFWVGNFLGGGFGGSAHRGGWDNFNSGGGGFGGFGGGGFGGGGAGGDW